MSFAAIGQDISLSAPAVKRRVDRLEAEGVITGYEARVDLGHGIEAFLEVFCEGDTSLPTLRRSLTRQPEVVGAYTVAGDAEAIVHVRCADMRELEVTIERLHAEPNIVRTRTQVVLTKLVERR